MHRLLVLFVGLLAGAHPAQAQTIDFESLPDSSATTDLQEISDQYAPSGVTFALVDPATGQVIGHPRIAKVGPPLSAFASCFGDDTPAPNQGFGDSFLTDNTGLGISTDLLVSYATPVAQTSGTLLDTDCRPPSGSPPCEQWTITALDAGGALLETLVIDAPIGGANPECPDPNGAGDAMGIGWHFDRSGADIAAIRIRYTGAATDVGIAFDNFSPADLGDGPGVSIWADADTLCPSELTDLRSEILGGLPPFSYQWQQETSPGDWVDLGAQPTQEVSPAADAVYRLLVTDLLSRQSASGPLALTVLAPGQSICGPRFLVSSYYTSSVESYGGLADGLHWTLVDPGAGGLSGTSGLACGSDGNLYVSSQDNHSIRRYQGQMGIPLGVFVSGGSGGLSYPTDLLFAADGSLLVASYGTDEVLRYDGGSGAFLGIFISAGSGGLDGPTGMVLGPDGDFYISSRNNDRVLHYRGSDGTFLGTFVSAGSGGLDGPRGLAFGPDGNLYVAEDSHDRVLRYDGATGDFMDVFVPTGSGGLDRANDLLFAEDGHLLVVSHNNDRVLRFESGTGIYLGIAGTVGLDGPAFLSLPCIAPPAGSPSIGAVESDVLFPNPFRSGLAIRFELKTEAPLELAVFDAAGRCVRHLISGATTAAGRHEVVWNGRDEKGQLLPAGVYFTRLSTAGAVRTTRLVLLK